MAGGKGVGVAASDEGEEGGQAGRSAKARQAARQLEGVRHGDIPERGCKAWNQGAMVWRERT